MLILKRVFHIDIRSLGLFRIFLGLILVLDTTQKLFLAPHFYSDWGVMPRSYWIDNYMSTWKWSLHLASGETWFQIILISLQLILALFFLLGYRSKLAGFFTLLLLMSLQARNNLVLSASDDIMRLGLLFSLFLPLDAKFSFFKKDTPHIEANPIAAAAIFLQLIYMYLFTAILKIHPIWHTDMSAVYFAVNIDMYAKALAIYLRSFPELMKLTTIGTLIFEFVAPITALIPGRIRLISALLFMIFHIGLFFTFEIGLFPAMAITYWMLFLTPEFWNSKVGKSLENGLEKLIALSLLQTDKSPLTETEGEKRLSVVLPLVFISLITIYNIDTIRSGEELLPKKVKAIIHALNINQVWNMFAPYPIKNDGWFVIEGHFTDGTVYDLGTGKPTSYAKPAHAADAYTSSEWRKYMLHVWDEGKSRILLPFGRYLCRRHSSTETGKSRDLSSIRIDFVKETTPPMGQAFPPVEVVNLWNHDCFAK